MSVKGNFEALLSALVAAGRETAIPVLGAGRYVNDMAYGSADASDARDWARQQLSGWQYTPEDTSGQEAAYSALGNALMGVQDAYGQGAFGLKPIMDTGYAQGLGQSAQDFYAQIPEDVKAGADMATGMLDVADPFMKAGALGHAMLLVGKRGKQALEDTSAFGKIMRERGPIRDYEKDVEFIPQDTIDYSIDERLGRRMKSGAYRGAPAGVASPQRLGSMRTKLESYLLQGTPGRDWYDESTQAISDMTGGGRNKKHLAAGTTAITSRGAAVSGNQLFGVKGYNQAIAGNPAHAGRFPNVQGEAIDQLASGTPYVGGPKETPFYEALTIDERPQGVRPTNDLWMARAFGYKRKDPKTGEWKEWSEGLGQAQHRFMDNEITRLVEKANKTKLGGHDDWTPERVQAAIWVAVKAEKEGTSVEAAMRNFSHSLDDLTTNIRYESRPSTSLGDPGTFRGTPEHQNMVDALLQNESGQDRLALNVGMQTRPSVSGFGEYEDVISPSTSMRVMTAPEAGSPAMEQSSRDLVEALAAARAMSLGQDTVGWSSMRRPGKAVLDDAGRAAANIAAVNLGRVPDGQEMKTLNGLLKNEFGDGVFALHTDAGVQIVNDQDKLDSADFMKRVKKLVKGHDKSATVDRGYNSGGLVGNTNWDDAGYKPSVVMQTIDEKNLGQDAMARLEYGLQDEMSSLSRLDALIEKSAPGAGPEPGLLKLARSIMVEKGFDGIREAVKQGILPAAILALLGGAAYPTGPEPAGQQSF